jgi:RNA polymerase sigma-70 factor (sigma-E family)
VTSLGVLVDFDEFVTARGPALLRLALMLTGDAYLAQDLVQSALASAYRHWRRVEAAEAPQAYVRQILVREHLSWRRRRSSEEIVSDTRSESSRAPTDVRSSRDATGEFASRDAAWALLARLPRTQRAVLALRYYEDLSDAQIAAALGCSAATVRSNAARALATLRTVVPDLDEELLP